MTYKGYSITKEYEVPMLMGREYLWSVFTGKMNLWFDTLKEAKEWVNKQLNK